MSKAESISAKLESVSSNKVLLGFDGFVDEIIHVVDKRIDADNYTRITTMKEYAKRIDKGSGLNTNIELVSIQKKIGGNGPILANALINYGMNVSYIGALGYPETNPIYKDFVRGCNAFSITDPSHTEAYEFTDGKIIASKLEPFNNVTWENIIGTVGRERFIEIASDCSLIGMENWTMLPHLSDIWKHFLEEVAPVMKEAGNLKDKTVFFDIADPEKRCSEDILEAMELITKFKNTGFNTVLGLNRKESLELLSLFEGKEYTGEGIELGDICRMLTKYLPVDILLLHHAKQAVCMDNGNVYEQNSFFIENPVIATGAGDTFNSGFILGYMNGCTPEECLLCGNGAAGYYISHGKQPSCKELVTFIKENY